jgi:capsule polysaccharide export protein KpsE/RkpR
MAGISLPSSREDKAAQMIELIKSRKFVKHLMTFENILPSILAAKSYNNSTQELLFNQKLYESETKTWKNKPKNNRTMIPSYLEAHKAYIDMLSIARDKKTGFISINIEHISPVFAKDFLELIIRESNELLRKKDMEESKQGLEYLTSELSKTPFVEIKESINALIEVQLETQMLAQINQDYILIEIEPPFIPEQKSKPSRTFICVTGTMLGGMLSVLIVLIRRYSFVEEDQAVE